MMPLYFIYFFFKKGLFPPPPLTLTPPAGREVDPVISCNTQDSGTCTHQGNTAELSRLIWTQVR